MVATIPRLTALKLEVDTSPAAFGLLRDSSDALADPVELRARVEQDGYLYIPGFFERDDILAARRVVCERLQADGWIDPDYPAEEAVCVPGKDIGWAPQYAENNPAIDRIVFGDRILNFYSRLLGGPARAFDYKWFRPCSTNQNGAPPHCDIVYMGRGTHRLYTAWIPYGDVSFEMGGLMMLEGSYRQRDRLKNYTSRDVDTYCVNYPDGAEIADGKKTWHWSGWLTNNPVSLREKLGGRWLTAEFKVGDLLTFSMFTIHAFLDNQTKQMRITSDTRYQLASDPVDERWISIDGQPPIAHGPTGKRGRIC